ncbi:hypothetical protein TRVA0_023S00694 [Trichomonascus vanleenenianus]|uniref:uncharacterized protein n=1 Tax=Trichomonascus vanleenenianus TaxID=2268995 RepID=UPI003ECA32D7
MDSEYRRRLDLLFGSTNPNNSYRWKEAGDSVVDILETTSDISVSNASSADTKIDPVIPVDMQARKLDKSRFAPYGGVENDSGESSATLGGSREDDGWEDIEEDQLDEADSSLQRLRARRGSVQKLAQQYTAIFDASDLYTSSAQNQLGHHKVSPKDPLKESPTKRKVKSIKKTASHLAATVRVLEEQLAESKMREAELEQKLAEPIELNSRSNTTNSNGTVLANGIEGHKVNGMTENQRVNGESQRTNGVREQSSMPELKSILKKPSTDAMTYRLASEGAPQHPKIVQLRSPEKSLSYNSSFVSSAAPSIQGDDSPSMASTDLSRFQEQPNARSISNSTFPASSQGLSVESYDDDFELRSFDDALLGGGEEASSGLPTSHGDHQHGDKHCTNCEHVAAQLSASQKGMKELADMVKDLLAKDKSSHSAYPDGTQKKPNAKSTLETSHTVYQHQKQKNPEAEKVHGSHSASAQPHLDNNREYWSDPYVSPNQQKGLSEEIHPDHLGIYSAPGASSTHQTSPNTGPETNSSQIQVHTPPQNLVPRGGYINTATQTASTPEPIEEAPCTPINSLHGHSGPAPGHGRRTNYEAFYRTFRSYYGSMRPPRRPYHRPHFSPPRVPRVVELNTNSPPRQPRTQQESTPPPPESTPRIPRQPSPPAPRRQSSQPITRIILPEPTPELIENLEHLQRLTRRISESHIRSQQEAEHAISEQQAHSGQSGEHEQSEQGQSEQSQPPHEEDQRRSSEMKVPNLAHEEDDLASQLSYVEDLSRARKPNLRVDIADDYNFINDELSTPVSPIDHHRAVKNMISELNRMSAEERDEVLSFVNNGANAPQKTQPTQTPDSVKSAEKELSDLKEYIKSLHDGQSILEAFEKPHYRSKMHAKRTNQARMAARAREQPVETPSQPQSSQRMITADMMPDAHRNVPDRRKLYYKLKLDKVDKLDVAHAQNVLKNILIQLMVPFDEIQTGVVTISKELSEKIGNDKFIDQFHRALYNGTPMATGLSQRDHATCLHNMILHLVQLCSAR